MHFQFLIEDQSSEELIKALMKKIIQENASVSFDSKSFRGIGGFTKRNTVKETKTGKLLNDLATYLRGFNKSLQGISATVVIVLDNDDRDTALFRSQLEQVVTENRITIDHVFCIAVEEVEAWLLGDKEALLRAYPRAKLQVLQFYTQDSICGTWELLADVVYFGGLKKLRRDLPSYREVGKIKAEWAKNIGIHMDLNHNESPSFAYFIAEIHKRIAFVT